MTYENHDQECDMCGGDEPCTPGDEEWNRRFAEALMDPSPMRWWWLSFATPEANLGVCLAPGPNSVVAAFAAAQFGCNPGGEVAAWMLPGTPKVEYRCRLFVGDEAHAVAVLEPDELLDEGWDTP